MYNLQLLINIYYYYYYYYYIYIYILNIYIYIYVYVSHDYTRSCELLQYTTDNGRTFMLSGRTFLPREVLLFSVLARWRLGDVDLFGGDTCCFDGDLLLSDERKQWG